MRSRSNSGVKLDNYARIIQKSILKFQVIFNALVINMLMSFVSHFMVWFSTGYCYI